jgi:hypothetical protein
VKRRLRHSPLAPWLGLTAPPVAWALHHQIGSDLIFHDCRLGETPLFIVLGAFMALICLASAVISWESRPSTLGMGVRAFAAYLGTMTGALFFLALTFQTLATLMLPACNL